MAADAAAAAVRCTADRPEIAAACACDITSAGVQHGVVLERCLVLSGVNAEDGRLRGVSAIPGRADGWKITERIQSYLRRDGNRAVVAR